MAEKKSIYEEALLDVKKIQEALNANTKEILRSVAREEIDGLVKESLEEDDYEEEAVDDEDGVTPEEGDEEEEALDADSDLDAEEGDETEIEIGGDESDDTELDAPEVGPEDQEIGTDADDASIGDEMNMIGASDDDVIAIYKKLSGDDEIEVVGDEIHINVTEPGEYIVKKGALGMSDEMVDEIEETDDFGEGMTYEIAMGDDDEDEDELPEPPEEKISVLEDKESMMDEEMEEEEEGEKVEEKISVNRVDQNRSGGDLTDIKGPGAKQGAKFQNESASSKAVIS
jgi:hypothetical protein